MRLIETPHFKRDYKKLPPHIFMVISYHGFILLAPFFGLELGDKFTLDVNFNCLDSMS